ncbi:MAG: ribonuclease HII [Spirochaetota bacterium]
MKLLLQQKQRRKHLPNLSPQETEENRALARFFFEQGGRSYRAVIGVDEVGRGALFGPVTVGAVLLSQHAWQLMPGESWFGSVKDSKLVKKPDREKLAPLLEAALPCAVAHVSVRYIDRHNINTAIRYGIYRAVQSLLARTNFAAHEIRIVADGNYRFEYPAVGMAKVMPRLDAYVKADQKYFPVSAASIVAKVKRDALIESAARRFAGYGLERHAGYGTVAHREAIARLGETIFHRKSFRGKAEHLRSV